MDVDSSSQTPTPTPPTTERGRMSSATSSPEFEFWTPSHPQPPLLTADQLFVDGVILPLHRYHARPTHDHPEPDPPAPSPSPAAISSSPAASSKRWKDMFRVGPAREKKDEKRRRWRKNAAGGAPELNINIWPFSRSRSAGNATAGVVTRKTTSIGRKCSSAPCSRSNSRGESSSSKAVGIHVGRSAPIWQIRRTKKAVEQKEDGGGAKKANGGGGVGIKALNLNVNTCIGYGNQTSCGGDDKRTLTGGDQIAVGGGSRGSHFNLKVLFSKKVY